MSTNAKTDFEALSGTDYEALSETGIIVLLGTGVTLLTVEVGLNPHEIQMKHKETGEVVCLGCILKEAHRRVRVAKEGRH